ncbi:hypothetical protein ACP70R_025995 [Stipagrostis hirtigluma subsp. patula]
MAAPMASRKASSFFALAIVALLVSSCYASRDVPGMAGAKEIVIQDDPKCEVMVPCLPPECTEYCVRKGLQARGFCTFKPDLQFYCCCPVSAA